MYELAGTRNRVKQDGSSAPAWKAAGAQAGEN